MKRFFTLLALASAALLLGSCAKERFTVETPSNSTTITFNLPAEKTFLGDNVGGKRALYWSKGDSITVNGVVSEPLDIKDEDYQTSAQFTFEGILDTPYRIAYPATIWTDNSTVTLPAVANYIPLVGYQGATGAASLKYATSVLHFAVKKGTTDNCRIACLEVSAEGVQFSGVFSVDFENGTIASAETVSAKNNYVRKNINAFLGDEATDVFIPVPAGTYAAKVKVIDVKGHYMEKEISSREFKKGQIHAFPEFAYEPTGTVVDVHITTAAQWNAFATAFNDGDYDAVNPLVVSIDADLDFTDVEPVKMTKSFNGYLYGNNHYFKNMQYTNQALVTTVGTYGGIKEVKISDSKLTVDKTATTTYFATLVADLQGTLEDCESSANMDFVVSDSTVWFIGGLAGRTRGGSIVNCTYSGTMKNEEVDSIKTYSYIGGITGDANENSTRKGSVESCVFSGKILMGPDAGTSGTGATGIKSDHKTGTRIGGIAGRGQDATVTNCSTTSDAVLDIRGDFLVLYVGGILGNAQISVTGCNNAATVSIWSANTNLSGGAGMFGGVAGSSAGSLSGCNNSGTINISASHRNLRGGGIIGQNGGNVTNCTNSGAVTESTYYPRYAYIGGIIGQNTDVVTDVHNTAAVTVSKVQAHSDYGTAYCGGVFGWNQANTDGTKIDNSGAVTVNIDVTKYLKVAAGGIAGCNALSLSNASNTGVVTINCPTAVTTSAFTAIGGVIGAQVGTVASTISGCSNTSKTPQTNQVHANITSTTKATCKNWCEGGIIGLILNSPATVSNCYNYARIRHSANTGSKNITGRTSFTGGIVGRAIVESSTVVCKIESCRNDGSCYCYNYNNENTITTGPFMGGIIGAAEGIDGNNIIISNCESSKASNAAVLDEQLYGYRGILGGVAGYTNYVSISGCMVPKTINGNANALNFGGMVGYAYCTSIENGEVSSAISNAKTQGGIVSLLGSGTSVTGTKFSGKITSASVNKGAIAGTSETNTSITNAKIGSKVTVNGVVASTADSYVCGGTTINATITGTTIE